MKKKITALVMAAAMCLSVAACGSSDNGGSGDTAKDTYTVGICSWCSTRRSMRRPRALRML